MSEAASSVLGALASIHQSLTEFAVELQTSPLVSDVHVATEPRRYATGDVTECYADFELVNGHAFVCWLEFRMDAGSWLIESSVRVSADNGEEELIALPTRYAVDDNDLVQELEGAARALVHAGRELDFSKL
jgi:hypothetical protein